MADEQDRPGVSRREFLKISGLTAAVPLVGGARTVEAAGEDVQVYGPGKTPITLNVNGRKVRADLEPRVTLLDGLRDHFNLTGAKRVCDRGECGACTVLLDKQPVYACSLLAIDVQGREITTVEALGSDTRLDPVQQAFVNNDAQQCGFCTPGFVVACKAFLDQHPHPSDEDIRRGLSGNLCRCGTYEGIRKAIAEVSGGAQKSAAGLVVAGGASRG
jgi:xanthine dehydrogenase YagT iron-sulfur-binding subunit